MGQALCKLALDEPSLELVGAIEAPAYPGIGDDIAGVIGRRDTGISFTSDVLKGAKDADVLIDFTRPQVTLSTLKTLKETGVETVIIGTTGFNQDEMLALQAWSRSFAIVFSGNFSLGVNMLAVLVERAAKSLGDEWDIEVLETHHRHKVDAPSGTALLLGDAAAKGRGYHLKNIRLAPYDGDTGERPAGKIGFSVRRSGGVIGEHEVSFGAMEEVLSLSHQALDRNVFARGALKAAEWAAGKAPGWYTMKNVLGL